MKITTSPESEGRHTPALALTIFGKDSRQLAHIIGDPHSREALEEVAAVAFGFDAGVEDSDDAAVGAAADQAADALFKRDDRLRDAVFEERLTAVLVNES